MCIERGYRPSKYLGPSGLQRDVVYLGRPIAPSYMSPNAKGGGVAGSQTMSTGTATHRSRNKLRRSNSIFNLCSDLIKRFRLMFVSYITNKNV